MDTTKRQNQSGQIIDYILQRIEKRELKPGDKLLNERDFAEQLGVSRVPLREAISALSALGILTVRQGEGTFVNQYDPSYLSRILYTYFILDNASANEIMEIDMLLEAAAALLATRFATEEEIAEIERAMHMRESELESYVQAGDIPQNYSPDTHFHKTIAEVSHNGFLMQLLQAVRLYAMDSSVWEALRKNMEKTEVCNTIRSHQDILDAIRARQEMQAFENTYRHMNAIRRTSEKSPEEKP